MKENLKIETQNKRDNAEATKLFRDLGYLNVFADELNVYAIAVPSNKDPRTVSFDELRELAREKEYLNDKFELVVTNQPDDGWILVPDGAECFLYFYKNDSQFFYRTNSEREMFDIFGHWRNKTGWSDTSYEDIAAIKSRERIKILWQRNPKETTMNTEKKGRFLHQEWYEAFGRGEDVQYLSGNPQDIATNNWQDLDSGRHVICAFDDKAWRFRLKPKTITIGTRTINAPISVKPERNTRFYLADIAMQDKYNTFVWNDSEADSMLLGRGICHLTKEDAVAHIDALLELMK